MNSELYSILIFTFIICFSYIFFSSATRKHQYMSSGVMPIILLKITKENVNIEKDIHMFVKKIKEEAIMSRKNNIVVVDLQDDFETTQIILNLCKIYSIDYTNESSKILEYI